MTKQAANLVDRLKIIAKDRAFIEGILKDGLSREQQQEKVRSLLSPPELARYDAGMRMIEALGQIKPREHPQRVDLRDVSNLPKAAAEGVKQWLQDNAKDVRVYGSLVDWMYVRGIKGIGKPADIDVAIDDSQRAAKELAAIIHDTSGHRVEVVKYPKQLGYGVVVVENRKKKTAIDIHPMKVYKGQMPYGWDTKPPIMIDGIPFEQLGEQLWRRGTTLLNPGVGLEGRGMIGPTAAHMKQREKDLPRLEAIGKALIIEAQKQGKTVVATAAENDLAIMTGEATKPYPVVEIRAMVPLRRKAAPSTVLKLAKKRRKHPRQVAPSIGRLR